MWIKRDLFNNLTTWGGLESLVLLGPRQSGKSSLLKRVPLITPLQSSVTLDDLSLRQMAQSDPALLLNQFPLPILIDEVQYAPEIFSEIKIRIDQMREQAHPSFPRSPTFRLTGSNLFLLDSKIQESLAGRATRRWLHPLSIHELSSHDPKIPIETILFQGGWPELYKTPELSKIDYLNDYIRSYLEKDIAQSAGITKVQEFLTVLKLAAARSGALMQFDSIANDSGVKSPTVKSWLQMLARLRLVDFLEPWHSDRNLRLIKTPKFYFLDTGLAARLMGYLTSETLIHGPSAGALFETLVYGEIVKTRDHCGKSWDIHYFREKGSTTHISGQEVDFVITAGDKAVALDAKLAIQNVHPQPPPKAFQKLFPQVTQWVLVTLGGTRGRLSNDCIRVPVRNLFDYLLEELG